MVPADQSKTFEIRVKHGNFKGCSLHSCESALGIKLTRTSGILKTFQINFPV
jgi:hypothetical protein